MRVTDVRGADRLVEAQAVQPGDTLLKQGLIQIAWSAAGPEVPATMQIIDISNSPGELDHLAVWQTCRLVVADGQGQPVHAPVAWISSHPELVSIGQGGLLQRRRASAQPVTITATVLPDNVDVQVTVAGIER